MAIASMAKVEHLMTRLLVPPAPAPRLHPACGHENVLPRSCGLCPPEPLLSTEARAEGGRGGETTLSSGSPPAYGHVCQNSRKEKGDVATRRESNFPPPFRARILQPSSWPAAGLSRPIGRSASPNLLHDKAARGANLTTIEATHTTTTAVELQRQTVSMALLVCVQGLPCNCSQGFVRLSEGVTRFG